MTIKLKPSERRRLQRAGTPKSRKYMKVYNSLATVKRRKAQYFRQRLKPAGRGMRRITLRRRRNPTQAVTFFVRNKSRMRTSSPRRHSIRMSPSERKKRNAYVRAWYKSRRKQHSRKRISRMSSLPRSERGVKYDIVTHFDKRPRKRSHRAEVMLT